MGEVIGKLLPLCFSFNSTLCDVDVAFFSEKCLGKEQGAHKKERQVSTAISQWTPPPCFKKGVDLGVLSQSFAVPQGFSGFWSRLQGPSLGLAVLRSARSWKHV